MLQSDIARSCPCSISVYLATSSSQRCCPASFEAVHFSAILHIQQTPSIARLAQLAVIMSDSRFTYQHMTDLALKSLLEDHDDEFKLLVADIPEPGE